MTLALGTLAFALEATEHLTGRQVLIAWLWLLGMMVLLAWIGGEFPGRRR